MKKYFLIMCLSLIATGQALSQIQTINIGTSANDRTGDPIRTAFDKTNDNFDYLDDLVVLKANLASPTFTGTPAAPTASAVTSTTQLATTAFVHSLIVPVSSSGTAIAFDVPRTYGYSADETGNITLNSTGLREGVTQLIIHNNGTEPTFGAEFKVIGGTYTTGVDNYIFCHAVKSNLILVTISQEQ